ncbi:Omega-hydroxypalmitate O-feruloyl transferase [Linum perenne]
MVEQNQSNVTQNPETTAFQLTVKKWNHCLVSPAETKFEIGSVYFLSNIDDDLTILRTIYCFKSDSRGNDAAGDVIKDALSKVLVHYYPLAGRVTVTPEGKFAVKCTGEGVVFVEAEANYGQSAVEFIISWAEIARGISPISNPPFLDRTILKARIPLQIPFHHPEFDSIEHKSADINPFLNQPNVSEYIHFTPQMIQTLKSRAAAESLENRAPSTYEALSAFVWIARTKALQMSPDQLTKILLVANTRGKFNPPLPKGYFGNAIKFTPALSSAAELVQNPISYTVSKVREAIKMVSEDGYLRSAIDYYELTKAKRPRGFGTFTATSWSRLDFEATDFGWGGAILTEAAEIPSEDTVVFLAHPTEKRSINVILWKPSTMVNLKVVLNLKVGEPTLVAPAEPTTKGIYFLSNVDDEPTIIRTLYCFKSSVKGNEHEDACEVIKTALSNVLVHYYPLAGRMTFTGDGRRAIDCTGEGVVFVEAEADCEMDKIVDLKKLDEGTRGKMVYDLHGAKTMMDYPPLMAQVTKFKCGGFVLGLAFSHFAADGMSAVEFVNSWGETARGIPLSLPPYLDRTMLKARTPLKIEHHHQEYDSLPDKSSQVNGSIPYEEVVYNFVQFNPGMIDKIKQEISTGKKCSTFKALTAFVWRARTIALKMAHDQLTRVIVVVNARDKFEPPLPKGYFGNAIKFMPVTCMARELVNEPLSYAVGLIQDAIDRVDDGLLRSTIDYYELTKADRSLGFTCISSAWGGLAFGSTNLGWGEPVATGPVELPVDEGMLFLREYESMYVYIWLPVSAMNTFQELVQQI